MQFAPNNRLLNCKLHAPPIQFGAPRTEEAVFTHLFVVLSRVSPHFSSLSRRLTFQISLRRECVSVMHLALDWFRVR